MEIHPDCYQREDAADRVSDLGLPALGLPGLGLPGLGLPGLGKPGFGALGLEEVGSNEAGELAQEPQPAVRIRNGARSLTISVDLPGVEDGDILVRLVGAELVISGERRCVDASQAHEFVSFYHTIALPRGVLPEHDRIRAFYHHGTLEIRVPKQP